ncbi:MAG TPA: GGDEF domain-containing protein [Devosia sp.]|nr:GGDEF domain-containing protein [Devosia sp.]
MAGFAGFSIYAVTSIYLLLWMSNMLLTGGFVIFYGAACLFTEKSLPGPRVALVGGAALTAITLPFMVGFDALGAMVGNLINALILTSTALKFWEGRQEAPLWVSGIAGLYALTALSFLPCAIMIFIKGPLVLDAPPSGWAEDLNSITGLIGLTGIGALSLAVNQARVARQHREQANTDPLTGLLNRRALFDLLDDAPIESATAVLVFDLDQFKAINDRHGHAAGDEALRRFSEVLRRTIPTAGLTARMGGEEFVAVLPGAGEQQAIHAAESIRSGFACEVLQGPRGAFRGTVSVGLATPAWQKDTFHDLLKRADDALYAAKGRGRNQVVSAG